MLSEKEKESLLKKVENEHLKYYFDFGMQVCAMTGIKNTSVLIKKDPATRALMQEVSSKAKRARMLFINESISEENREDCVADLKTIIDDIGYRYVAPYALNPFEYIEAFKGNVESPEMPEARIEFSPKKSDIFEL